MAYKKTIKKKTAVAPSPRPMANGKKNGKKK